MLVKLMILLLILPPILLHDWMYYVFCDRNLMILLIRLLIALRHLSWSVSSNLNFSSLRICLICNLIVVFFINKLWLLYLALLLGTCVQDNSPYLCLSVLHLLWLGCWCWQDIGIIFLHWQYFLCSSSLTIIKH